MKREKYIPMRCSDDEIWRLSLAAAMDRLPTATWLRRMALKRADELGVPQKKPGRVSG